jgi:uncharacterized RDD family membrane protein YckC
MKYAGFWVRVVAFIIDTIILAPLGWVFYLIEVAIIGANVASDSYSTLLIEYLICLLISIIAYCIYYAAFESSTAWQATPGKRLLSLKVTDLYGGRISFLRACGRYFAKWISGLFFCIGYIMVGVTEKKQGFHDILASTLVLHGRVGDSVGSENIKTQYRPAISSSSGSLRSKKIIFSGFDSQGHVVRLNFDINSPALMDTGIFIGRDSKTCDLSINDGSISRTHARIFKKNEALWIEDLDSTNGCYLNGKKVVNGSVTELPTRGVIMLGEVELSINES